MNTPELTILMPCLNEAETLEICIQKAKAFLSQENISGEILIADNGSQDGSQHIAEQLGARVVHVPVRGYGAALLHGIHQATGKYIIMGDADDSYNFLKLNEYIKKLREGYDLVMGNRFRGKIEKGAMPFLNKYLGNPVLSLIGRIFFKSKIGDFHCGLRGFNREAIQQLDLQSTGMEFASEMIVKATLQQLHIAEVPTTLSPDGRSRRPHLRPWRDGWRHLKLLLLLSPRWLFFYPGLMLMTLGMLFMYFLSGGPVKISQYCFDIHTMLFSSVFVIAGLQAVFFYIFAKQVANHHSNMAHEMTLIEKFIQFFTLEKGLVVGILFLLIGIGGSIYSFLLWMQHAFGPLLPSKMMRLLIPSFTFLISGLQVIFASFFFSLLSLHFKKTHDE